mgnify:CR=1 FL=1
MKKILIFHFDLQGGGAEKVLVNLLNNLDLGKYDVTLQTIFGIGPNVKDIPQNVRFKYLFKKIFRGFSKIMKMASPRLLHRLFIREKYDIEIAFLETSPTRIISACPNKRTKKIAWVHTTYTNDHSIISAYRNRSEAVKAYNRYDHIAFVSKNTLEAFQAMMPEVKVPMSVVHNIMDFDLIKRLAQDECPIACDRSLVNLYSVGRLTKVKGFDRLIKSLSKLANEGITNFHLYLLGQGEEHYNLLAQTNDLGLSNYISFLGYDTNPYRYAKQMDLFVCSSYIEGYSTAVTEAITLGVPVITTKCSGMDEILKGGEYGMIVPNDDNSLLEGLKELLLDTGRIDEYRQRIATGAKMTTQSLVSKYEELFDTI